jgi:hypothetical protein
LTFATPDLAGGQGLHYATRHQQEGNQTMTNELEPKTLHTYRVTYSITRTEVYDIEATDEEDAEERGYAEGTEVEDEGETTDVVEVSTELLDTNGIVRYDTNTIAE